MTSNPVLVRLVGQRGTPAPIEAFAAKLPPDLVRAADPKIARPHALDLGLQVGIALLSRRAQLGSVPGDGPVTVVPTVIFAA